MSDLLILKEEKSSLVLNRRLESDDMENENSVNDLKEALKHYLDNGSFLGIEYPLTSQDLGGSRCLLEDESFVRDEAPIEKTEPYYRFYWTSVGLIREAVDTGIYSIPEPPQFLRPTQKILTICQALHHIQPDTLSLELKPLRITKKKTSKPLFHRLIDKWLKKRGKFSSV